MVGLLGPTAREKHHRQHDRGLLIPIAGGAHRGDLVRSETTREARMAWSAGSGAA